MLKAEKVQAVSMQLKDGGQALLVQDGPDWNGLRKFKCVAPQQCEGQMIIAIKDPETSPLKEAAKIIFGGSGPSPLRDATEIIFGGEETWVVMMASVELIARLKC